MTKQGTSPTNTAEDSGDSSSVERTVCPQCRMGYLIVRHCKSVCEQCGYVESCEDNFAPADGRRENEAAG